MGRKYYWNRRDEICATSRKKRQEGREKEHARAHDIYDELQAFKKVNLSRSDSCSALLGHYTVNDQMTKDNLVIIQIAGKDFEITPAGMLAMGNDLVARARRMMPKKQKGYDDESQMSKM